MKVSSRSDITSPHSDHSKVPTSDMCAPPNHDIHVTSSLPFLFEAYFNDSLGDCRSDHYLSCVQVSSPSDIISPTFDPKPHPKKTQEEIPGCECEGFPLLLYLIGAVKPRPCEVLQLSLTRAPAGPFGPGEIGRDRPGLLFWLLLPGLGALCCADRGEGGHLQQISKK